MPMQVEIWSDVVCPWCYIGKRRFEHALERFPHRDDVQVVHRSFQLDPTAPRADGRTTAEVLAAKYGGSRDQVRAMMSRVESLAAEEGLEYHLDRTPHGNTLDAHRLLHLARARGMQDAVLERLYRAYFTEAQSVFDREALVRLGAEAGLNAEEARQVLQNDAFAADVQADIQEAAALGITGVPFFVLDGRYGVSGAQPPELFSQALAQAWAESHPLTRLATAGGTEADPSLVCEDDCCMVHESDPSDAPMGAVVEP